MNDQFKGPEIPHQPIVFDDYREIKWLAFKMLGSCLIFSFVFILVNFLPTTSGEWWGSNMGQNKRWFDFYWPVWGWTVTCLQSK